MVTLVKRNIPLIMVLVFSWVANANADEFIPSKLTSASFGSSISHDTGDTFFGVLGIKAEGEGTHVVAYTGKTKLFEVNVASVDTVNICDANSNQQVVLKRTAANDACITSLLNGNTGSVSDLATTTSSSCNCFYDDTATKRYRINDSGTVLEVTSLVNTSNSTNQMTLSIYKNGGVTSVAVPTNSAPGELKDAFLSGNGIVSWQLYGFSGAEQDVSQVFFSYDPSNPTFKSSSVLSGALPASSSFKINNFRVNSPTENGLIVIADLIGKNSGKSKRKLFQYNLSDDTYSEINPTQANLRKHDYETRNDVGNVLCMIAPKYRKVPQDGGVYVSAVLANGDAYSSNGFFLKHKHTSINRPYCFTSQFKAVGTCEKYFTSEPLRDLRFGEKGDIVATPNEEGQKQAERECSFEVFLKKANKKALTSTSVLLTDQNGSKASIKIDSNGVGRFRVSVDPSNICNGPTIQGPYNRSDLHGLTKFAWAAHCV